MNKILIDAFGGDNSPSAVIEGTITALKEREGFIAVLVGNPEIISEELKKYSYDKERVEILPASEVITCEEEPTIAIRKKPDSSICVAIKELRTNDDAKAFVSAGSTGAVLVGATLKLGRILGVNRPALTTIMPTLIEGKNVVLLDAGANADCKAINLCQFAFMGSEYAKIKFGIENPKVGLLSNGAEDEKGNMLNHEVFPVLKEMKEINFIGNVEARDILVGEVDVIVTDGFSGNVAVKSIEGAVQFTLKLIKQGIYSNVKSKIGGMLLKGTFNKLRAKVDHNKHGGAVLLGAGKLVVKAHGSSKASAFTASIKMAVDMAEAELTEKIKANISAISVGGEQ